MHYIGLRQEIRIQVNVHTASPNQWDASCQYSFATPTDRSKTVLYLVSHRVRLQFVDTACLELIVTSVRPGLVQKFDGNTLR